MNIAAIPANDTVTFLDRLRASTSRSHKQLESLPLSAAILSPEVSKADYALYLSAMYDVMHETENRIFPLVAALFPDLEDRKKIPLLDHDLEVLETPKAVFEAPFGEQHNISIGFALGIFYVAEGSTLGGRYIIQNIQSALGFDESRGARYFAGYGHKTGSYWKNFLKIVTTYEQEHDAGDEIISGADYAFNAIHNHFLVRL